MNLLSTDALTDWDNISPLERSVWQRIAAQTHGWFTPANIISTCGGVLVGIGLIYIVHNNLAIGIICLISGRLADSVDGTIANLTKTKSRNGALLDAGIDKIVMLASLIVLVLTSVLPLWLALIIAAQNTASVVIVMLANYNHVALQPSRLGKITTAGYWVGLIGFICNGISPNGSTELIYALSRLIVLVSFACAVQATFDYLSDFRTKRAALKPQEVFDRFVVIRNPVSSDSHRAMQRISALRSLVPQSEILVIDTVPGGKETNAQLIRDNAQYLGSKTLLCIAAGDGTINMILNILLHDKKLSHSARSTCLLPLWCGNANDLAYMLNGAWSQRKLQRILQFGKIVSVRPLETTITNLLDETTTHTAASYTSFGATAYATLEIERSVPRNSLLRRFIFNRWRLEAKAVIRALIEAPTFTITGRNSTRRIYERTYFNGSRFARVIGIRLRLTDAKFHRVTIEKKDVVTVLLHILGLLNGREIPKKAISYDTFTVHDKVWAQFDGEPVRINSGSTVEIATSNKPFYALSLRLSKH